MGSARCSLPAAALLFICACTGALAEAVVLRNANGMEVHVLPTGACLQRLLVPDAAGGPPVNLMMSFDDEESYKNGTSVSGCIVGRVGGRISGGRFTLDGETYQLETGKANYTMHGGGTPYNRREWTVEGPVQQASGESWVELTLDSPAGDQAFPGSLNLTVVYTLTDENELLIDISAVADAATPVNVFSHPYFNLAGLASDASTILDHVLLVNGSYFAETDTAGAATGAFLPVAGTPLDFTSSQAIGARINETDGGYTVSYLNFLEPDAAKDVENFQATDEPQLAATLLHPASGRGIDILTTAPSLVLYTGNSFKGKFETSGGVRPQKYGAVALETTMFSEAVNQPTFPSEILRPGEQYSNRVVWRFTQSPPSALASALRESPAASAAAAAHGVSRLAAVLTLATAGLLAAWM